MKNLKLAEMTGISKFNYTGEKKQLSFNASTGKTRSQIRT